MTSTKKLDEGDFTPWDLAQIWIESVAKEETGRKQWEHTYGWMADYDAKVNFIRSNRIKSCEFFFSGKSQTKKTHIRKFNPIFQYGWREKLRNKALFIHLGSEFSWP